MKSFAVCPVSDKSINERVSRINGLFTVLFLLVFGLTMSPIPIILLLFDFFLRTSDYSKFSPIAISSKGIVRYLRMSENKINAGPKLFAARIGFTICSIILICIILNSYVPAMILAGILGLFSFLEAAFGLCVACEIYPVVYRLLYKDKFQNI
jgi:hypothetical protein